MSHEGHVEFRGHRTWYRIAGDGPGLPLVALHGGPGSTHAYFAPLERLGAERRVVLYDQIGCGRSDKPRDLEWSAALFRDELAALREQLGLERIHLLGTSWGGMLALEHVLSGATGVASLILSSTLASLEVWNEEQLRLRAALPADAVAVLDRHEASGEYDAPEYEQAMEAYYDRHLYRGPKPRRELDEWAANRSVEVYRAMQGPNEWTTTGALLGWDVRDRLHEIDVPTLVIRGRFDMCTDRVAADLTGGIRGAREAVLEESSHMPVLEEPDRYLAEISHFMREVEAG